MSYPNGAHYGCVAPTLAYTAWEVSLQLQELPTLTQSMPPTDIVKEHISIKNFNNTKKNHPRAPIGHQATSATLNKQHKMMNFYNDSQETETYLKLYWWAHSPHCILPHTTLHTPTFSLIASTLSLYDWATTSNTLPPNITTIEFQYLGSQILLSTNRIMWFQGLFSLGP